MAVTSYCFYFFLALLPIISRFSYEAKGTNFNRYRSTPYNVKNAVEKSTETSSEVQNLIETDNNRQNHEYGYGNIELNLVRSNKKPQLRAHISTKYTTSIISDQTPASSLEDAETAEEYVSKAIQRYGSRLKEPIRIEPEPNIVNDANNNEGKKHFISKSNSTPQPSEVQQDFILQELHNSHPEEYRSALDFQSQLQLQEGKQQEHQKTQMEFFQTQQPDNFETFLGQPAPVYEKDHQSSLYHSNDDITNLEGSQPIDRHYRTKYVFQPMYENSQNYSNVNSDKIRVSASTEIPKAEIIKQIEKSVIKYIQDLEAEGKIITAPKEHSKTYYKLVTVPVENKRVLITTTTLPKYQSTEGTLSYESSQSNTTSTLQLPVEKSMKYKAEKSIYKHQDHSEKIASHQPQKHGQRTEGHDSRTPSIKFVYKIKTISPLQAATIKTLSKPYVIPQKPTPEQFDHSAVLKSMEEFDLSHVVNTKDIGENFPSSSDQFHVTATEDQKFKNQSSTKDYNGYSAYFAEPATMHMDQEIQSKTSNIENGFPIVNPFQYKVRKQHPSSQFDVMPSSPHWDQPGLHIRPLLSGNTAEKPLDYDGYNYLKYNNHQDSYKHLQPHFPERDRDSFHTVHKHVQRYAPGPRGKRGEFHNSNSHRNAYKATDAGLVLRPPTKV